MNDFKRIRYLMKGLTSNFVIEGEVKKGSKWSKCPPWSPKGVLRSISQNGLGETFLEITENEEILTEETGSANIIWNDEFKLPKGVLIKEIAG